MGVAISEQETTINFSRDSDVVTIWTSDRRVMTKLDRMVEQSLYYTLERVDKTKEGDLIAKVYAISHKRLLSFRKNIPTLTPEQKKEMAERLERLRVQRS